MRFCSPFPVLLVSIFPVKINHLQQHSIHALFFFIPPSISVSLFPFLSLRPSLPYSAFSLLSPLRLSSSLPPVFLPSPTLKNFHIKHPLLETVRYIFVSKIANRRAAFQTGSPVYLFPSLSLRRCVTWVYVSWSAEGWSWFTACMYRSRRLVVSWR